MHPTLGWNQFTKELLARFGPSEFENCIGALIKLCQTGSVKDYLITFEKLANHTTKLLNNFFKSFFIMKISRLRYESSILIVG